MDSLKRPACASKQDKLVHRTICTVFTSEFFTGVVRPPEVIVKFSSMCFPALNNIWLRPI